MLSWTELTSELQHASDATYTNKKANTGVCIIISQISVSASLDIHNSVSAIRKGSFSVGQFQWPKCVWKSEMQRKSFVLRNTDARYTVIYSSLYNTMK